MLGEQEAEPRLRGRGRSSGSLSVLGLPQPGPLTLLSLGKVALETYPGSCIALGWGSTGSIMGRQKQRSDRLV